MYKNWHYETFSCACMLRDRCVCVLLLFFLILKLERISRASESIQETWKCIETISLYIIICSAFDAYPKWIFIVYETDIDNGIHTHTHHKIHNVISMIICKFKWISSVNMLYMLSVLLRERGKERDNSVLFSLKNFHLVDSFQ